MRDALQLLHVPERTKNAPSITTTTITFTNLAQASNAELKSLAMPSKTRGQKQQQQQAAPVPAPVAEVAPAALSPSATGTSTSISSSASSPSQAQAQAQAQATASSSSSTSSTIRPAPTLKSPSDVLTTLTNSYTDTTPPHLKLIDAFLVFLVLTGVVQFGYCVGVTNFPFNSFVAGFASTVGQFVLAASLRIQANTANSSAFPKVSPERAFADFLFGSIILHFFVINFLG